MRFFKHGDSLAIVLPEKLRKSSEANEQDDYEFFELEKCTFVLISRKNLEEQARKSVYAELLKSGGKPEHKAPEKDAEIAPEKAISQRGFAVIISEDDARRISKLFEKEIKANEIMGIRGFDKKFYVVSGAYFKQHAYKIMKALGSRELALRDIALQLQMDESGCLACLMLLKEQGELIEKRRGVFKAIR